MESMIESNENRIFESKIVKDFYDFHWNSYAKHVHYFGAIVHFIYLSVFVIYVNEIFLNRNYTKRVDMCYIMLICIVFPIINDGL